MGIEIIHKIRLCFTRHRNELIWVKACAPNGWIFQALIPYVVPFQEVFCSFWVVGGLVALSINKLINYSQTARHLLTNLLTTHRLHGIYWQTCQLRTDCNVSSIFYCSMIQLPIVHDIFILLVWSGRQSRAYKQWNTFLKYKISNSSARPARQKKINIKKKEMQLIRFHGFGNESTGSWEVKYVKSTFWFHPADLSSAHFIYLLWRSAQFLRVRRDEYSSGTGWDSFAIESPVKETAFSDIVQQSLQMWGSNVNLINNVDDAVVGDLIAVVNGSLSGG